MTLLNGILYNIETRDNLDYFFRIATFFLRMDPAPAITYHKNCRLIPTHANNHQLIEVQSFSLSSDISYSEPTPFFKHNIKM